MIFEVWVKSESGKFDQPCDMFFISERSAFRIRSDADRQKDKINQLIEYSILKFGGCRAYVKEVK